MHLHVLGVHLGGPVRPGLAGAPDVGAGIGAAEAEGRDPREVAVEAGVRGLCQEVHGEALHVQVRVDVVQVQVGGATGVRHHQAALQQARQTGATLQVPDVAFRTGGEQRRTPGLHDTSQSTNLDGVAQRGASAVALCDRDLARHHARLAHGVPDARLLRLAVRRRERGAAAVLVHGAARQACNLLHAVLFGVARLDVGPCEAVAPGVAAGAHVEGEAAALRRQHAGAAERDEGYRVEQRADAHAQGILVALVGARGELPVARPPEVLHGHRDADQRR
mmetsp:Transcript_131357/g.420279  ORF Transcript_131357/g.420279 Transcript_131357/m.420279 type:complete len:278 (+) Transcript_131357:1377-2210(+)